VSLLLHALAFGLFAAAGRRPVALPTKQAEVELLMVERQGSHAASPAPQPNQRPQPAQSAPAKSASAPKPPPETPKLQTDKSSEPIPPPAPKPEQPPAAKPQPPSPETPTPESQASKQTQGDKPADASEATPPSEEKAPKIDFSGTGAASNADVLGGGVLPASPDNRYRNMPPPYPVAAAERGEHGTVTVMIHVDADGAAAGADVIQSSGFASLDASAVEAVKKWHFHPALRDAHPVPFDFPFRFEFRQQWTDKLGP
jgi:protein TonB